MSCKNLRCVKSALAAMVLVLWLLTIILLSLVTVIRDDLSRISLVTEGTSIGNFYLGVFFPVIFPVIITVSCFIFVIGCLGCCGAFTESQTLLGWFFFSILVTFCVELSSGVWRIVDYDLRYNATDVEQLKYNIDRYAALDSSVSWFKNAWREIHSTFDCCGVYSYEDWLTTDTEVLASCCPKNLKRKQCAMILIQMDGCGAKVLYYLSTSRYITVIPYITGVIGIVQVVVTVLTLKIWLVFCINVRTPSKEEEIHVLSSGAYAVGRPHTTKNDPQNVEYGFYLTPLKSYKDRRNDDEVLTATASFSKKQAHLQQGMLELCTTDQVIISQLRSVEHSSVVPLSNTQNTHDEFSNKPLLILNNDVFSFPPEQTLPLLGYQNKKKGSSSFQQDGGSRQQSTKCSSLVNSGNDPSKCLYCKCSQRKSQHHFAGIENSSQVSDYRCETKVKEHEVNSAKEANTVSDLEKL